MIGLRTIQRPMKQRVALSSGPAPRDRTEDHPEANEAVGSIELNLGVGRKGWAKPAPSQLLLSPGSQDEDLTSGSQHCLNTGELMNRLAVPLHRF